ncbi:MAG: hypothetical protein ACFHWX_09060 [Bacteroidota bacterium]
MQSDIKEPTVETTQKSTFKWVIDKPASEDEQKVFWNQLKQFYRTGELPQGYKTGKSLSIFSKIRTEEEDHYPFKAGDLEFVFNPDLPFEILKHQIADNQKQTIGTFKQKLQDLVSSLSKLLNVQEEEADNDGVYDFAKEIIAFDKLSGLIPKNEGTKLSKARSNRLMKVFENLKKGLEYYGKEKATLLVAGDIKVEPKNFNQVNVQLLEESKAFATAEHLLTKQMNFFVDIIQSLRIAELEVEGDYQEEIHDEFFTHFTWYRLSEAEKNLFLPFILVLKQGFAISHLDKYSRLLTTNWPIKMLVLNHQVVSEPDEKVSWEDASHRFRQELTSITISHRSVFTFQTTLDDPKLLFDGLSTFVETGSPAVAHILIPSSNKQADILSSWAALAGRYFPAIKYDPNTNKSEGNRISLEGNKQPGKDWPIYHVEIVSDENTKADQEVALTYADYKAINLNKMKELLIIPSGFPSDHLVLLTDYLTMPQDQLVGKIPYIWLTDDELNLSRAAVPNVWVVSCQERLDFWNFLKEIGGVPAEEDGKVSPEEEIAKLKATHQEEIRQIKDAAVSQAAEQLIQVLLTEE